jgi:hypothetical protein
MRRFNFLYLNHQDPRAFLALNDGMTASTVHQKAHSSHRSTTNLATAGDIPCQFVASLNRSLALIHSIVTISLSWKSSASLVVVFIIIIIIMVESNSHSPVLFVVPKCNRLRANLDLRRSNLPRDIQEVESSSPNRTVRSIEKFGSIRIE